MRRFLTQVASRSIIRVKSENSDQVGEFLQGLITNDMRHLREDIKNDLRRSMYAMFLNPKGRTLFDTMLYSTERPETFYVECDKTISSRLQKHLKMYKLRRNVEIDIVDKNVWALFEDSQNHVEEDHSFNSKSFASTDSVNFYDDPRAARMGLRIIASDNVKDEEILNILPIKNIECADPSLYRYFRYKLGISEGTSEIPIENSFPLEANCDYLHGISFHKGCYIGQELTARTHHTGVVRKRLMPLIFENEVSHEIPNDTTIYSSDNNKTAIGKLRGISKDLGLALLRINEALAAPSLIVMDNKAKTFKPSWWPIEATKEKISS